MTSFEKEKAHELRLKGWSFANISSELNVSVNTIKSFFRRNKASEANTNKDLLFCKQCCKQVKQSRGRKVKLFCSDTCRMKWWNSNQNQINKKGVCNLICPVCKVNFYSYGSDKRKYCSHNCYIKDRFYKEKIDE